MLNRKIAWLVVPDRGEGVMYITYIAAVIGFGIIIITMGVLCIFLCKYKYKKYLL